MATLNVLLRSLFAFVVVAVVAIAGFLISDTQPLDDAMRDEEIGPSVPPTSGPSTSDAPPTTDVTTVPPTTRALKVANDVESPASVDDIPQSGTGAFVPARSTSGITVGTGNIIEFSVAAEQGSGIDPDILADTVDQVLSDRRSWIAEGNVGFRRIETGGLFSLVVATAQTVDQLCAPLRTNSYFSCARNGWVALNLNRWHTATDSWTASLEEYRTYVINHEVGHYLARPHVGCPAAGEPAPVMMQQTKTVGDCQPNGWPYP